MNSEIGLNCCF